jgi:hypothetical protein
MSLNSSEFKTASTFLETLKREVGRMQALYPDREGELARAHALILHGMVVPSADDPATGQVLSSDASTVYHVNGTCTCRAGEHGQGCKHMQAWKLYQYIAGKVEAQPVPEVVAQSDNFPEAPASVNVRVLVAGREVQWTLRDSDEARLATRLAALLQRYPQPQSAPQASSQGEGWCAVHNVEMRWNAGKEGRKGWHSHRTPDGQWCKGR